MNIFLVLSCSINGIFFVMLILNYFSKKKYSLVTLKLQDKLISFESNTLLLQERLKEFEQKKIHLKSGNLPSPVYLGELLDLRKETANLKSELKRLKEDIRHKEKELKGIADKFEQNQYGLLEEKRHLLEQLKSLDQKSLQQNNLHNQAEQYKESLLFLQNQQKNYLNKIEFVQEKLKIAEKEVLKLKTELLQHEKKETNFELFDKWRQRALAGKKMYLHMRQLRELSESKILTYEEGIITLSKWVLERKNIHPPMLVDGESKAERYFAYAWNSILSENNHIVSSIPHLTNPSQEVFPI